MRILFIAYDIASRLGGIQRFDQRVLRCLGEMQTTHGVTCTVLAFRDAPFTGPHQLQIRGFRRHKPHAFVGVLAHLLRGRYDLLLLDHVSLSPLCALVKLRAPRVRTALFVHGVDVWDDRAYRRASRLEKCCCRHGLDRIIAVSHYTARRMQQAYIIPPDRFSILPNAIDLDDAAQPASPVPLGSRILTVSRLDEWEKGIAQVIRALPLVVREIPDVQYVIAGDGILRPRLEQLARDCKVESHVQLLGRVSDEQLVDLYRSSRLFIMPSQQEGFGIVYLEAWKHCLPVIAGNRDAAIEVIDDGINGLTVDPTSPHAIAHAITRLLTNPTYAQQLGFAGHQKLCQHYHHERFHSQLEQILLSLSPHP
ncbi:MAG: glycosyltransferase family 4 protein [Bacillota bacterium]